eukprot:Rhum_TRINITY_DN14868_c1_g1::Rhum_TRINITY_DN14868_c1_g1_i1::g.125171::m.125171
MTWAWGRGLLTWAVLDADARKRALRLLQGDIVHSVGEDSGSHELMPDAVFEGFCREHPEWADPSQSWGFFRDHAKVKALSDEDRLRVKVTRVQHSGLCYMHAPAVLQHYLVTLHSNGQHHEMLNVAKYIVQYFNAKRVYKHVVGPQGESSLAFLRCITDLRKKDLERRDFKPDSDDNVRRLQMELKVAEVKKYGVGLVSEFQVEPAFQGPQSSFLANALTGEVEGFHAMTLVGHREKDGQHIFLLQNWWRQKQFVEVSAEYLAAAGAAIAFVKKEVTEIRSDLPSNKNVYSMETEDVGEELDPLNLRP